MKDTFKALAWLVGVIVVLVWTVAIASDHQAAAKKANEVTIPKAEYEKLKVDAMAAKQVGRYQMNREGTRVWRLDTATGESCLLLATEYDLKHDAKSEKSCP